MTSVRAAATRETLIAATESLLRAGGLAAVTTQSVARKGSVAEGTIYRHFESRDALIASTVCERLHGDFGQPAGVLERRAGRGPIEDALIEFVAAVLTLYSAAAPALAMLAADPQLAARSATALRADGNSPRQFGDRIAEFFGEEQRLGRAAGDIDKGAVAGLLVGACFYRSLMRHLFGEDPIGLSDGTFAAAVATILARGIRAQA